MLSLDLRFSLLHKHFVDQILLTFVKGHPILHAFLEEELSVVLFGHFLLFPLDTDPQGQISQLNQTSPLPFEVQVVDLLQKHLLSLNFPDRVKPQLLE